jgi:hypothetical protein
MNLVGLVGCLVTTSLLAAMTAPYSGTTNRAGNAMDIFFIFLYLVFQLQPFWTSCSFAHPTPDRADRIRTSWLEVLSGYHLLVHRVYPE